MDIINDPVLMFLSGALLMSFIFSVRDHFREKQ